MLYGAAYNWPVSNIHPPTQFGTLHLPLFPGYASTPFLSVLATNEAQKCADYEAVIDLQLALSSV